ncbi:hypothetical protein Afil01_30670 [Actinorhabdospora filicis]|uniref:Carrier domain-containing protein n=1 Tax=Actinorhabdospora filicis TaxID=1785913 RepID=A0A9W6WB20_9ACTN|nr:non-ribosomal peptide synthetase [Actinorhabdospora filicis]GLZ78260.1 hypothetical protein Afil01_30670 [Actinorhabdospora filicis]
MTDDLSARLAALAPEHRAALLRRVGARLAARQSDGAQIPRRPDPTAPVPASALQGQLWFLDKLAPGQTSYNVPSVFRLTGPLDVGALRRALTALAGRHETLRTTFTERDGSPYQVIAAAEAFPVPLSVTDLSDMDGDREAEARKLVDEEVRRPFDLAQGPLFRALLVVVSPGEHLLAMTMHHIVSDGWSQAVLTSELGELYSAQRAGRAPALPELAVQYADYALWQRGQWREDVFEEQLSYWASRLKEVPATELPADRPRPATLTYRSDTAVLNLDAALLDGLRSLSADHDATLFMTLMAAYHVLLARYTGGDEIVVGTTTAGRSPKELEPLIGYFVNMVVLRTDVTGDPTFAELLSRVRRSVLDAWKHQDVPFEKVVERLAPRRDPARNPLFQLGLQLLGSATSGTEPVMSGLVAEALDVNVGGHPFDLSITGHEGPGSLRLIAEYSTDLFDAPRMERLLGHLAEILRQVAADPAIRLSALDLLSDVERERILAEWQGPPAERDGEPVHVRIGRIGVEQPDLVACRAMVDGEWRELTYGELHRRVELLARRLRSLGVGREDIVAVLMERGFDVAVSMVAAQRAGGAFVVLDPGHPTRRLEFILADTAAKVVLTRSTLADRLPEPDGWTAIPLDTGWAEIEAGEDLSVPLPELADGDSLAYVLYTSGSTGKPKGVMVEHHALNTFLLWMGDALYGLGPGVRVLQHMALIFDFAEGEMYATLTRGATLVFAPEEARTDPEALGELLASQRINYFDGPPAILGRVPMAAYPDLRGLIAGGEAVTGELINRWNTPGRRFINGYGPTEAAVGCVFYECEHRPWTGQPPIGRAMPGRVAYVLDRYDRPLPIGVPGEVVVGAHGLARGYLNRPELTAEKFIDDPLRPGENMYRTGDLGMWTEEGQIQFLGRIDTQVKLHGLRIELEEIESALVAHPRVAEAAVALREDAPGDKRLVAYIVAIAGETAPDMGELRPHLLAELPPYMVPAVAVPMDRLPLAPSGKVDRAGLPSPEGSGIVAPEAIAPRTPQEERVAAIFAEILGLDAVGAEGSFFELGGNSLQAARVLSRIGELTGVTVTMREFYLAPLVSELAARVAAAEPAPAAPVTGQPDLRAEIAALEARLAEARAQLAASARPRLSMAQEQLWFLEQLAPGHATYNIQVPLRLTGPLNVPALHTALTAVLDRHEALRTRFEAEDGYPYPVIEAPRQLPLPVDDLSGLDDREEELARALAAEAALPFDLSADLMIRARLYRLDETEHVLSVNMHHICSDGWSTGVFAADLATAYDHARHGREPSLPTPPVTYAEFAEGQRRRFEAGDFAPHLDYWSRQLHGLPTVDLPADRPRPAEPSYRGALLVHRMPAGVREGLRRIAREAQASPYAALLAGFAALLARHTGAEDLPIGTADAGRARSDLEGVIGFFVNMLVLRNDLTGDPTYRELTGRTMGVLLDALDHREAPFEKLVESLQLTRDPSRNPLFTVSIDLLDGSLIDIPMPGLAAEFIDVDPGVSRFDMAINVYDAEDGLTFRVEYSTDLFDHDRVERMFRQLEVLLTAAVAEPELRLSQLPLMTDSERAALEEAATGPVVDVPARTLPSLVDEWAERTPHAIAVIDGDTAITYADLAARSRRAAARLHAEGIGAGAIVATCLPRGTDHVIAALAVLRTGAASAPLDPAHPAKRREFQLADMGAALLIDAPLSTGDGPECTDLAVPDAPAFVIYTSGSTGEPKGMTLTHHQIGNILAWLADTTSPEPGDRFLHCCNPIFDVSLGEIFGALTTGATLVIAPPADLGELGALVTAERVTHILTTPTLLSLIPPGEHPSLRYVITAGEPCRPEQVRDWNIRPRVFINAYGPAETTILATSFTIPEGSQGRPPIGRPLPNTTAHPVDRWGAPTPVGVPGELHLGGLGVTGGYLNRPELSAERFTDGRYRTGDLAVWTTDHQLAFLGRNDAQVKIRGLRVEPGEIEHALIAHPGVSAAAVAPYAEGTALAGYIVATDPQAPPGAEELRAHLLERLPSYMVPGTWVYLDALPRSASGKLARKSLPAPERATVSGPAPEGALEREIAAVFAELLGTSAVSAEGNFFTLGGTSLQAIQAATRLTAALSVPVSIRDVYNAQTVAALAEALSGRPRGAAFDSAIVELRGGPDDLSPLWCMHAVSGSPYSYHPLSRLLPERRVYGMEAPGLEGDRPPVSDLRELAAGYAAAIRARQPHGPYLLAGWSMGGFLAFEAARLLRAEGANVGLVAMLDSAGPGPYPRPGDDDVLSTFAEDLAALAGRPVPDLSAVLTVSGEQARLSALRTAMVEAGVLPADVSAAFTEGRYGVFRANMLAMYAYRPAPCDAPVVHVQAADEEQRRGWEPYATGGLRKITVEGDHYTMWAPEHIGELAGHLARLLAEADGQAS